MTSARPLGRGWFWCDAAKALAVELDDGSGKRARRAMFVANDNQHALPVEEQNLDADGNIKVHEQGTADVNVTNMSLPVAPPEPVTSGGGNILLFCPAEADLHFPRAASLVQIGWTDPAGRVRLMLGEESVVADLLGPFFTGDRHLVLPLTRAVAFDRIACGPTGPVHVILDWQRTVADVAQARLTRWLPYAGATAALGKEWQT